MCSVRFAATSDSPGGAGQAEVDLGSLEVTTDSQGQAVFDIPFTPPGDKPLVTGTATDPQVLRLLPPLSA